MVTANEWVVTGTRDQVALLAPPRPGVPLTREQAVVLAAWLVAIADPDRELFERVYREITS